MEEKILNVLKEVLEIDSATSELSSSNCEKWDSMAQLNIAAELESVFDVSLEPEEIAGMASFKEIVNILKAKGI